VPSLCYPNSVRVTLILIDQVTNQPLEASKALEILQQSGARIALLTEPVQCISAFTAGKLNISNVNNIILF